MAACTYTQQKLLNPPLNEMVKCIKCALIQSSCALVSMKAPLN